MSNSKLPCGECVTPQRVTTKGLIFKHGECPGGGKEPLTAAMAGAMIDDAMASFTPEAVVKTGYTAEDLHEMLWNLTPKRKKLRERVRGFFDNLRNYFNGAWDVYDDE